MQHQGIGTWIARKATRYSDDIALVYRDQRITYGVFAERIDRLANALFAGGVARGDRVAYLGNNHPAFLETLFAVATLGAIFVPLNTRLAAPEIEYALDDSGSTVLIFHENLQGVALAGSAATSVTRRMMVEEAGGDLATDGVEDYDAVLRDAGTERYDVLVGLDDRAMILYTSGTTGRPKGAVLTHGNFTWNSFNAIVDKEITKQDRVLLISPLFHVAALGMGALPSLLQGGMLVLHEKFDPGHVLETIEAERITMLSGVPTTFQLIQEHPAWETTDISSLTGLTCGGSAVPLRVIEAYEQRGLAFAASYGMTETSPGATAMPPQMTREKPGSSGLTHFFSDIRVIDETGAEVPAGVDGEICMMGPNVISEYWQNPEATEAAFIDGWFRSGDIGHLDEDGYIYISDRLKDMIISGGENIYPAEVEAIVMERPEVGAVAIIGVPDDKWGEVPLAVVELKPGATPDGPAIMAHLAGRLAKYKIPKRVEFIDEFPRTASGKIRKADLRRQYG
ncbi:acyl-CoA synthetase [Leucobacter sp. GX0328]